MEFTTKLDDSSIDIGYTNFGRFKGVPIEDKTATATVKWSLDFEAREWGLKSIDISIQDVALEIDYEYYESQDEADETIIKDTYTYDGSFEIVNRIEITSGCICPNNLEIDFTKKQIIVS